MEISNWKSRWRNGNTGWHLDRVYPPLVAHWERLNLEPGDVVLVPLCGKSRSLEWLAEKNIDVFGVEVSAEAASRFFEESGRDYEEKSLGPFRVLESGNITYMVGDFFNLESNMLPSLDAVYDRGAIVALPPQKRAAYARLLLQLTNSNTRMLVGCYEYEQDEMNGPPFAVTGEELQEYYGDHSAIELLEQKELLENNSKFRRWGLKSYLGECVYLLRPEGLS